MRKDIRVLGDGVVLSNLTDRHVFRPYGLNGGHPGSLGQIILNPGSPSERRLHSKELVELARGDVVSFRCSGSGGVGPPAERSPKLVLEDARDGLVSLEAAKEAYGVDVGELISDLTPGDAHFRHADPADEPRAP